MRIKGFAYTISKHLQKHNLNNSTVVIDGQNYFHDLYKDYKIPIFWGPECNTYANDLRRHLKKFKDAKVKCYFVFKGGCENGDIEEKLKKQCSIHRNRDDSFNMEPRFMKDIYKQVLDELGFKYVVCDKNYKNACIALAQKLSCPIISFNVKFCFSGADYIPFKRDGTESIVYNKRTNRLDCEIFRLNDFLSRFCISKEMFSIFVVLTDEYGLQTDMFSNFFEDINIPLTDSSRNRLLLSWFFTKTTPNIIKRICKHLSTENQTDFLKAKDSVWRIMENTMKPGIAARYLMSKKNIKITEMDPLWFEKGIVLRHIPQPYIDLYNFQVIVAFYDTNSKKCHPENCAGSKNSLFICLDIVKYAFDLLTNFSGLSICFKYRNCCKYSNQDFVVSDSIPKPKYVAKTCVFESGWNSIKQLKLFHHFILNTLPNFKFKFLDKAPESAQLLIIALVYFTHKKSNNINIQYEISSIMLSYVMLRFVLPPKEKWTDIIPLKDCAVARSVFSKYFSVVKDSGIRKSPCFCLYEFQDCLEQLNYLNILCGKPFVPTTYSETYNATFVYNCTTKQLTQSTLRKMLSGASTLLELYTDLMQIYKEIVNKITS